MDKQSRKFAVPPTRDLKWNSTLSDYADSPTLQCGDRKCIKRTESDFSKNSTMHGARYICSSDHRTSNVKKYFYRLFVFCCFVWMLVSVTFLSLDSFSAQSAYITSTSKPYDEGEDDDPYFPKYPRITICRKPTYRTDFPDASEQELMEYAHLSLSYPFVSLTPEERSGLVGLKFFQLMHPNKKLPEHLQKMDRRMKKLQQRYDAFKSGIGDGFDLEEYLINSSVQCEEIFIHCIAVVFTFECCKYFHPVLTPRGLCFVMDVADVLNNLNLETPEPEFSLDLTAVAKVDKAIDNGYEVHLSDPRNLFGFINVEYAQSVWNGMNTIMKTELEKMSREALHTPWHGLFTHCPRLPADVDPFGYGDRYFLESCRPYFLDRVAKKMCGCSNVVTGNSSMRTCDPADVYECVVKVALADNLTSMGEVCVSPCVEYHYKSEVNFASIGVENMSRLIFAYNGIQYSLHEYNKMTFSEFLSQIGGILGLCIGASIITVFEMVNFGTEWLWYHIVPTRRKPSYISAFREKTNERQ